MSSELVQINNLPEAALHDQALALPDYGDETRLPEAEEHRLGGIYLLHEEDETPGGGRVAPGSFRVAGLTLNLERMPLVFLNVSEWRRFTEPKGGDWICFSKDNEEADPSIPDDLVPAMSDPLHGREPSRKCADCLMFGYKKKDDDNRCKRRAKYLVYDVVRSRVFSLDASSTSRQLLEAVNAQLDELTSRNNAIRMTQAQNTMQGMAPHKSIPNTAAVFVLYSQFVKKEKLSWYQMEVSLAPHNLALINGASQWPPTQQDLENHGYERH